jgi:hypothetical protein
MIRINKKQHPLRYCYYYCQFANLCMFYSAMGIIWNLLSFTFSVYLTFSVAEITWRGMIGWLVNNELERI